MKIIEYKFNKSYSTILVSAGLLGLFLLLFQFINFRENTLILTVVTFFIVFLGTIYGAFFYSKKVPVIRFLEDRIELPLVLSTTDRVDQIMYRDFKSLKLFEGDISNRERPGYTGIELKFERVEHLDEVVFFQRKYLEEQEYQDLIESLGSILSVSKGL